MEAPAETPVVTEAATLLTESRRGARARLPPGALSVTAMEQKFVNESQGSGIFGGRRKAGRESLYIKGTEPENVVDVSMSTSLPEIAQLVDPESRKASLSFLLNTEGAAVAAPMATPPPPASPLMIVDQTQCETRKRRSAMADLKTSSPASHALPVKNRGRELPVSWAIDEVNELSEGVALRDAEYATNVVEKTTKDKDADEIESGFWKYASEKWKEATFINCDLRYFNLAALGKFDVVLMDPPWRIKGNEMLSSERRMFNNSSYQHDYGTLSNSEILDIDVGSLCDKGFLFLWVINSQLQLGLECLKKWGYTYTDRIVWVRKNHNGNVAIGQGFYFLHSTETCLVGVKYRKGETLEFISKVNNDVIFAEVRERSRKPDQLYQIIERMLPGSRKIELFARNHSIRKGWLSLGNELGEYYDWDHDLINCDHCKLPIKIGTTRYKSRTIMDHDLCGKCIKTLNSNVGDYFEIANSVPDMVFHEYFECDSCHTKPIWGIRFHCLECSNLDLCEACYDAKYLPPDRPAHKTHVFKAIELPDLAGGLPVHRFRCAGCNVLPIIGYLFVCATCPKLYLCQKCFYKKKQPRNHSASHEIDIVCVTDTSGAAAKCDVCAVRPIPGDRFRCTSCYLFEVCEACHTSGAKPPSHILAHKPTHTFTRIKAEPVS